MGIDILIVDTPRDRMIKLSILFKGYCYRFNPNMDKILIRQFSTFNNDTSTYSNLSEDDLAILEFLPDFDTRYTYLLSLSLGINA
mgnify:CR=1 FL=1